MAVWGLLGHVITWCECVWRDWVWGVDTLRRARFDGALALGWCCWGLGGVVVDGWAWVWVAWYWCECGWPGLGVVAQWACWPWTRCDARGSTVRWVIGMVE